MKWGPPVKKTGAYNFIGIGDTLNMQQERWKAANGWWP
jgi:hypothetical protein